MEQSLQVTAKREWCRENGLSEKTFYYWQLRLFDTLSQQRKSVQPIFAEITPSTMNRLDSGVAVTVRISGTEADIHTGAEAATAN